MHMSTLSKMHPDYQLLFESNPRKRKKKEN